MGADREGCPAVGLGFAGGEMSSEMKRKSDWEGRYVRLKFDTATNGGAIFKAGDVMLVERNYGGLHLKATRNCKECGQQFRAWIIKVAEREVELLPKDYIPSEHISRSDFLQTELAASQAEVERLRGIVTPGMKLCRVCQKESNMQLVGYIFRCSECDKETLKYNQPLKDCFQQGGAQ